MQLLTSDILAGTRSRLFNGRAAADGVFKKMGSFLRNKTGIIEFDTDNGVFRFVSNSSKLGEDEDEEGFLGKIGLFIDTANQVVQFGGVVWNNVESTIAQVESLGECFQKFKNSMRYQRSLERGELTPEQMTSVVNSEYATYKQQAADAQDFITQVDEVISRIDATLSARLLDPSLEPTNEEPEEPTEQIFRLEAGPPEAKSGKFLLSVDGLYYDSQTSGIVPALLELEKRESNLQTDQKWKLEFDPNLGGRGIPTSMKDLNGYFDTILDPNILDESPPLRPYYNEDILLQNLIGQKNRRIYDVSGEIDTQQDEGASVAIISNLRQVMLSEASRFMRHINKRKKQIELAVKMPVIYGRGSMFSPGEVPVNDFSYLEGINFLLDVEKQRQISISQSDVDGVVMPISTKYTQQIEESSDVALNHLLVANVGKSSIVDNAPSGTAPSISVNAEIAQNGLVSLYNFLTVKSDNPSGSDFGVFNGTNLGIDYNSQMIGKTKDVFNLGLGVPYLSGIAMLNNAQPEAVSAVGSYVKLPQKSEFQDLFYSRAGATFESWVHIPDFAQYDLGNAASGLYRLILANENVGIGVGASAQEDILNLSRDSGTGFTRGLIYGFTRDKRFTEGKPPSNLTSENPPSNSVLVLAPTQSYDISSAGFVVKKGSGCRSTSSWDGMSVRVSSTIGGVTLSSCKDEFCHLVFTVSPEDNEVNLYLDSVNIATSSYQDVFGVDGSRETAKLPSVFQDNSFEYNTTKVSPSSIEALKYGPALDRYFTPWIIGGGYTDGNPDGNFMGGSYGGKVSGLKGNVGGVKIYSRSLTPSEIKGNYEVTQNFFKNIIVSGIN